MTTANYASISYHVDAEAPFVEDKDSFAVANADAADPVAADMLDHAAVADDAVVADDAAVADPEVAAVADTAAVAVTTRKRQKSAKKHATNDGVDDFVIERQAISPLRPQQLA
jgi:hypothetical protein